MFGFEVIVTGISFVSVFCLKKYGSKEFAVLSKTAKSSRSMNFSAKGISIVVGAFMETLLISL